MYARSSEMFTNGRAFSLFYYETTKARFFLTIDTAGQKNVTTMYNAEVLKLLLITSISL